MLMSSAFSCGSFGRSMQRQMDTADIAFPGHQSGLCLSIMTHPITSFITPSIKETLPPVSTCLNSFLAQINSSSIVSSKRKESSTTIDCLLSINQSYEYFYIFDPIISIILHHHYKYNKGISFN